jgi:hypothetical protein
MEAVAAEGICPDAVVQSAEEALARDLLIREDRHAGQHSPQRLARIERQELRGVIAGVFGAQAAVSSRDPPPAASSPSAGTGGAGRRDAGRRLGNPRPTALVGARILVRAPEQEFDHMKAGGGMGRIRAARRLAQCLARDAIFGSPISPPSGCAIMPSMKLSSIGQGSRRASALADEPLPGPSIGPP